MFGIDSKVSEDMKVINIYDIKYQLYLMSNKELSVSWKQFSYFVMNTEAALLIKQNTIKENKQRLKVLLVFKGLYSAMLCTYF